MRLVASWFSPPCLLGQSSIYVRLLSSFLLAVGLAGIVCKESQAASLAQSGSGGSFHNGEFIYIPPPPTPEEKSDPKFYQGTYNLVVSGNNSYTTVPARTSFQIIPVDSSRTTLTQKIDGSTPAMIAPAPTVVASPTPVAAIVSQPVIQPDATSAAPNAAPVTAAAPAPTQAAMTYNIRPAIEPKLFHDTGFFYDPGTATSVASPSTSDTAASAPAPSAASTNPVIQSIAPAPSTKAGEDAANPASTASATTAAAPTTTIGCCVGEEIEDPRFYRGSFFYEPKENAVQGAINRSLVTANPPAENSAVPAPGTTNWGTSYETLSPSYWERTPLPVSGKAMYYNPGIMSQVYDYRYRLGQVQRCDECVGTVALLRAGDINRKVWIQWSDGSVEGPFLVIDVAAKHHISSLLSRDWVIDVDYQTAMRHGMNRPLPVTVLDHAPAAQASAAGDNFNWRPLED